VPGNTVYTGYELAGNECQAIGDDPPGDDIVIAFIETQGTYTHYDDYSVIDVSGALIDQFGNPVSGISVTGTTTVSGSPTSQSTTSGPSGAFSISFDIYEYGSYEIILETDTGSSTSIVVNVEGSSETFFELSMNPSNSITKSVGQTWVGTFTVSYPSSGTEGDFYLYYFAMDYAVVMPQTAAPEYVNFSPGETMTLSPVFQCLGNGTVEYGLVITQDPEFVQISSGIVTCQ